MFDIASAIPGNQACTSGEFILQFWAIKFLPETKDAIALFLETDTHTDYPGAKVYQVTI